MLLEVLMQYSCLISHSLSPLKRRFRDIQIVIITNVVVLTSAGVTRVNYILRISQVPSVYLLSIETAIVSNDSAQSDEGLRYPHMPAI